MTQIVRVQTPRKSSNYEIRIGQNSLSSIGDFAHAALGSQTSLVAMITNDTVFEHYGKAVVKSLGEAGFRTNVYFIGDGERFKSLKTLEKTLAFFGASKLKRTDAIIALGGGVVGDLAGFAASIYLRGIPFLQVPTTLLSMIDSSVGGKTGINTSFGKNLVGAFNQPNGVLVDPAVLATLPRRELTAGLCEAIKQGAIDGRRLFDQTSRVIDDLGSETISERMGDRDFAADLEKMLVSQVRFKAAIVKGDERESVKKTDAKSRKILNFGHTFAHTIEKLTNYRYFKHGEAVGHGIIFAAELSKKLELISDNEVELLNDVVHRAGDLPPIRKIDPSEVFETFKYDKKNIGNSVQWILLKGIGKPVIVSQSTIPDSALKDVIRKVVRT